MRKLALFVGCVALGVSMGMASSYAKSLYVDPENGTDTGNTTCGQSLASATTGPCATLNNALAQATTNDSIFITRPGTFGPIILTSGINIAGPADGEALIAFNGNPAGCIGAAAGTCGTAAYAVDLQGGTSDVFKFKNLIIANGTSTAGALHVQGAFNVSLTSTALRGGTGASSQIMLVDSSQGSQVQIYMHNVDIAFHSNGGGIQLSPSGATPIRMNMNNSEVHNAQFGIQPDATGLTGGAAISILTTDTQFFSFNNSAVSATAPNSAERSQVAFVRSTILNTGGAGFKVNGPGAGGLLYESVIIGNNRGVNIAGGGGVGTYSNNVIQGNGTDCVVSGTPTACSSALGVQTPN